eukprot:scaffold11078_cov48-Attheya_sp.AAC.2
MRFVPNIADPRYPVTSGTKSNIKILRGKQKSFLKNIRKQKSHTIQGLDFFIEEVNATLRQVIMGMRSSKDVEKTLFMSAEDDRGTRVTFTFHKHFEDEARHMVTVLPIMLQHLYGARIWSWFTEEAKAETSGWIYDKELGRVVSPDENYTAEMLNDSDWDDDSIEETEEQDLTRPTFKMNPKIILDRPAKSNHYNDNGTVKTFSPIFKEGSAAPSKPKEASLQDKPPSAVSTDASANTKAASSLTDGSPSDKVAMAKQFLAAMELDDELKKLFQAALGAPSIWGWRRWLVDYKPQFNSGVNWVYYKIVTRGKRGMQIKEQHQNIKKTHKKEKKQIKTGTTELRQAESCNKRHYLARTWRKQTSKNLVIRSKPKNPTTLESSPRTYSSSPNLHAQNEAEESRILFPARKLIVIGKFRAHHALFGYNTNKHKDKDILQYGGVGIVAVDESVNRARKSGKDPSGLGRWIWMRFQGQQGHMTRVISFYRPCHAANKEGSVWEQHVRYFRGKLELDKNPRESFYEDLFTEIETWKQLGDHIIIARDTNEDVRHGMTSEFFLAL